MTALIGGSLLLIVAAAVLLVVGWTSADQALIWTSIVASVVAGVLLSLGYYRSKSEAASAPSPERERPPRPKPQPTPQPAGRAESEPTQATAVVPAEDEQDSVIAYPDRSRFHRPDCRYAALPGGEKLVRETAVRRGYDPCGVCKP